MKREKLFSRFLSLFVSCYYYFLVNQTRSSDTEPDGILKYL
uniref:Uncharacterized protein n=1 Tax=Rhizophora mucronata TaxID=61149 RepID=A0A2P2KKW1_RHIMU